MPFRQVDLGFTQDFGLRVGVFARNVLAPALEDADVLSRARDTLCGDASDVPGADLDNCIVILDLMNGR